jgi:predicted phosphodiesterase
MKIAILSDIHGNLPALIEVLNDAEKQGIKNYYILGDQLGYYYEAQDVYELLFHKKAILLAGNHESFFLDFIQGINKTKITNKYGGSYNYYSKTFTRELIEQIKKLPQKKELLINNCSILISHSHPIDTDVYVYPDENIVNLKNLENKAYDFIFMGHTHYPMVYAGKQTTIINVGSVGQSRIKGGVADWGILNTENKVYIAQKTKYNRNKTIENLNMHQEKTAYLHKILKR